jgi:hypothetical protein
MHRIAALWDLTTGKITRIAEIPSPGVGAAFSADGRRLAVTFAAGVRVWDIVTHKLLLDNAAQDQPHDEVRAFGPVAFAVHGLLRKFLASDASYREP